MEMLRIFRVRELRRQREMASKGSAEVIQKIMGGPDGLEPSTHGLKVPFQWPELTHSAIYHDSKEDFCTIIL